MTREVMRYKLNELRMMLNDGEHTEEQGILVEIIKELDKAESNNKREWISANVPPKESGRYLTYIVNEYDEKIQYIMTADYIARSTPIEGLSPWYVDDECASDNVVAWQSLPEPYKAESEVKDGEIEVHILRPSNPEVEYDNKELPCCPICGSKAFISKDVVGGFYFGWSVGCPRACINDKAHKLNEEEFKKARLVFRNLNSREEAVLIWKGRCLGESKERR